MAGNGRGCKTRSVVWSWGCVFCIKAVWGGGGYLVVGRLQVSFYTLYIAVSCRVGVVFRGHCSGCSRFFSGKGCFWYRCLICFCCRLRCRAVCHVGFIPVMWVLHFSVFSCIRVVSFPERVVFGIVAYAFVVFGSVVAKGGNIIVQCVSSVFKTHWAGR